MAHAPGEAPLRGEGRLTDKALKKKLRRAKGPLFGGKPGSKPKGDFYRGLR